MKIKYGLILAAGYGTRMGEIGKVLPKVLWPIFERKIIDLQISYLKKMGVEEIFINTYFQADKIERYFLENPCKSVTILREKELLDIGGAVLNLQKYVGRKGKVIVTSGDQFMFFDHKKFLESFSDENIATFLVTPFKKEQGYNALNIKNGNIVAIIPNNELINGSDYITYSGMSIIDLEQIKGEIRPKKLYDLLGIGTNKIAPHFETSYEYFDFGTADRYVNSLRLILKNYQETCLVGGGDFFKNEKVLNLEMVKKIGKSQAFSYGLVENENTINLTNTKIKNLSNGTIVVIDEKKSEYRDSGIYYQGFYSKINH